MDSWGANRGARCPPWFEGATPIGDVRHPLGFSWGVATVETRSRASRGFYLGWLIKTDKPLSSVADHAELCQADDLVATTPPPLHPLSFTYNHFLATPMLRRLFLDYAPVSYPSATSTVINGLWSSLLNAGVEIRFFRFSLHRWIYVPSNDAKYVGKSILLKWIDVEQKFLVLTSRIYGRGFICESYVRWGFLSVIEMVKGCKA